MKTFKSVFSITNTKEPKPEKKPKEKVKKTKGKTKEKVEPKKRGRPSKLELEEKARIQEEADIAIKKEIIERQKAVASGSIAAPVSASMENVDDPNWIPPWPVFMPGQKVESTIKRLDGRPTKGTVYKDDVKSRFIYVHWDDKSAQYAAKLTLKFVENKVYKSLLTGKKTKKK